MISLTQLRKLSLIVHLCSVSLSLIIYFLELGLRMDPSSVESMGGTFSLALVMGGVIVHLQAKQAKPHPGLLALLGAFGPGYLLIGGTLRHVVGFHLVAMGFHLVVYMAMRTHHKSSTDANGPN